MSMVSVKCGMFPSFASVVTLLLARDQSRPLNLRLSATSASLERQIDTSVDYRFDPIVSKRPASLEPDALSSSRAQLD
jgi:hypothetical protein